MGIIYKPQIPMYWSTDIYYQTPIFNQVMKRDRFQLILKFFHFNDNDLIDPVNPDRLHKVRPLIEMLRDRFRKVYTPGMELSVDESLVLYKGRLKFCGQCPTEPGLHPGTALQPTIRSYSV